MKVPLSWLAEFVDLVLSPEELAERMTFAGLEVASIDRIGRTWGRETVLVGNILTVEPHPKADRLTLPTVDYGDGRTIRLVTGAPNIKPGMTGVKVPVALVGATLIDGHSSDGGLVTLKPAKLRGIESAGMVCSERELGLSDEHGGIMILPDDAPVGTPLVDYLGDTVLDVEPTPNLSRCLSILGVAREVAALTGQRVRPPRRSATTGNRRAADLVEVRIEAPELCARYCATVVVGVAAGPSPFVVRRRLSMAGQRPLGNLVDATNYIMFEMGQPQHAFDYALLRERAGGGKPVIVVRAAREGERIVTLDGVERVCATDTLLIADGRGPIAVAGVMGGRETEVGDGTTEVLLESATFNHASIRRTAQSFKLPSQASLRFGKGIPASLAGEASREGTALLTSLTGGAAAEGVVDACPRPQEKVVVRIRHTEFSRLLGHPVPERRVVDILESLDFAVREHDGVMDVEVPPYRLDVTIPPDLVEEVARMEGYDKLPATLLREYLPPQERNATLEFEDGTRGLLVASGLDEVITYSLTDEGTARAWAELADPELPSGEGDFIRVRNPLSAERAVMRLSVIPELLACLRANRRFQRRVAIFELGRVFHRAPGEGRPEEPRRLGVVLWGPREEPWWGNPSPPEMSFFDLKGLIERLGARLPGARVSLSPSARSCFGERRGAEVSLGGRPSGCFGELSAQARALFDLGEERVVVAELDLESLASAVATPRLSPPTRFPAVTQDIAILVDEATTAEDATRVIGSAGSRLLASAEVFDVYRGEKLPIGKKSLAFSLVFQSADRTLTEDEASRERDNIVKALQESLGATLRR